MAALLLGIGIASCNAPTRSPTGQSASALVVCAHGTTLEGIDVSEFQHTVNWAAVRASGRVFAVARISDGTGHLDPTFATNWSGIRAAGLIRGAYQYFEPSQDPIAQADIVVTAVGTLAAGDLPVTLDAEMVTAGVTPSQYATNIARWIARVQSGTGRAPIIYTGRPFWDANVNTGAFSSLPLWIAAYGPTCPNLPASWSDWAIFQYSSTGSIPSAISGNVDLDRFNGTMADLTAFANGAAPTQAPPPPASSWNCANSASGGVQYWTCDGGALYRCDSTGAQQRMTCANGCTVNPVGTDDACSNPVTVPTWNCANSSYMGRQFWTCSMGTLYRCDASGAVQMMGCSSGCTSNPPGTDDTCNTPAWNCANSSYMGMQYWTCSGGAIHRCDASGAPQVVDCPSGCNSNPVGTDDACNPVLDGGTDGAVPDASGPDVQGDAPALSDVAHADAPGETTMAGPDAGGESERGVQSGCGCRVPRGGRAPVPLAALFVAMALAAERRRSVPRGTRRPAN